VRAAHGSGAPTAMYLWLLAASPALRLPPPCMQAVEPKYGLPGQLDPKAGGAVPFAPLGSAGAGSTATGSSLSGVTGHYTQSQLIGSPRYRAARTDPNVLVGDNNAAPPKLTTRLEQRAWARAEAAAKAAAAAATIFSQPAPTQSESPIAPPAAAEAAMPPMPTPSSIANGMGASLVDKKNAITAELGVSGNVPTVAVAAADELGIDPTGKRAADVIDECFDKLFGSTMTTAPSELRAELLEALKP